MTGHSVTHTRTQPFIVKDGPQLQLLKAQHLVKARFTYEVLSSQDGRFWFLVLDA